jgi:AraC-like DNA-binding protein
LNQYDLKKDISIDIEVEDPLLEFVYCLSGLSSSEIKTNEGEIINFDFNKTNCVIFYFPRSKGKINVYSNESLNILSLHIAPDFLNDFIDEQFDGIPDDLKKLLSNKIMKSFFKNSIMTSEMFEIAHDIVKCEFEGFTKKMFVEGKALELMTRHIELLTKENTKKEGIGLRSNELEKIKEIKQKIDDNIAHNHSLYELARSVGFNHSKLNAGFKQLYNTTVFSYIRNQRLELSKRKLIETELSVSEIAYLMGYSSPSHFTREFSRAFDLTPKQYRNNYN